MSDSGIKTMRHSKQNFKIVMRLIEAFWAIFKKFILNIFHKISSVWKQETINSDLVVSVPPDRISELPDEIIYLILRKLQPHKLAARTSILSRRWLELWNSYPIVEFDCKQTTKFRSFATATSKRLNKPVPLLLESFSVSLDDPENLGQGLYELMSSAYGDGSPLRVVVQFRDKNIATSTRASPLVEGRMLLNCSRTKFLCLEGCDLSQVHNQRICLDNLQELTLRHVRVNQESFLTNYLANTRRVKKLSMTSIIGINYLDLISKFPSMVSVRVDIGVVSRSFGDDMIRISAHNLRELTVTQFTTRVQVEIDAPNLVTLTIDTVGLPINYRFLNVPYACRCVVSCTVTSVSLTTDWFIELRNCLATLAARFHHLVFKLKFSHLDKVPSFDLSRVGNESSPLVVQHLQLATDLVLGAADVEKQAHQTLIIDGLLWTCDPETVTVARLPNTPPDNICLFSYISDQIERENLLSCCSNGGCWRHQFKSAKITSVTVDDPLNSDKSIVSKASINTIFLSFDFSRLTIPHPLQIV